MPRHSHTELNLWQATKRQLKILVDAERKREGLDEILTFADYIVASAKFSQVYFLLT